MQNNKQEEFFRELLADFKIEAAEHYLVITNGLLELEKKNPANPKEIIEVVYRAVHSLKGAARAVSHPDIELLCQSFENVMASLKQTTLITSSDLFDVLQGAASTLELLIRDIGLDKKTYDSGKLKTSISSLNKYGNTSNQPLLLQSAKIKDNDTNPVPSDDKFSIQEMVRISTDKLSKVLVQAEELVTYKDMFKNHTIELKKLSREFENNRLNNESSKNIKNKISKLTKNSDIIQRNISRTVDDLLLDIRNTLFVPFSSGIAIFTKMVRDMSRDQKKEINFTIEGSEIEIDRNILDQLKDPMIHIIRNSVDHGIEIPAQRIQKGKSPQGNIKFSVKPTDDHKIIIAISDDGEGISTDLVLASAIREGVITSENAASLTEKEKIAMIFSSGVTTSKYITNISGRGLGLAIVAEKVSDLGGTVEIHSEPGKGLITSICVPLSMSTFRGVLVKTADQHFIVPVHSIERVTRIRTSDIHILKNQATVNINGQALGLLRLSDLLDIQNKENNLTRHTHNIMILLSSGNRLAFLVDEVIGDQEGIVKPLGSQLKHVRNFLGVIVIGNGQVVPVLNVADLFIASKNSAKNTGFTTDTFNSHISAEDNKPKLQKILVVEDSITSRSLLRNLLEDAGYYVRTSVDGAEAFSFLNNETFDLVVSDIEMPRLNGFELTLKIRSEDKLKSLPVVLVTSLESAEDRQRGLEAGANAYFIKSSFDQTSLMEVISRLI